MKKRILSQGVVAAACLAPTLAATATDGSNPDRVDAIAVYNRGAAVVQDTRNRTLNMGEQTIAWPLVGTLQPGTLWLQSKGVQLDGFSAGAASDGRRDPLSARIGQPVTLIGTGDANGDRRRVATLVGVHGDSVLVRVGGHIEQITASAPWRVTWPAAGAGSEQAPAPGLKLDIHADNAGEQPLTAIYQVDGPSWQAHYTGRFDADSATLSLQAMAMIDNRGGERLRADKAWLVAGDVARASGAPRPMMMARSDAKTREPAPQAAGDVYRYALNGPLDVPAGRVRAVSLVGPVSFKATRRYRIENSARSAGRRGARSHAEVRLYFSNSADAPLPAGLVRVYAGRRSAGLIGEDRIGDTPSGAPVDLGLGRAFDITADRRVVSDAKNDAGQRTRTLEIVLHNAGSKLAPVDVIEHLPPAARIASASEKVNGDGNANTAHWQVNVSARRHKRLRYTVQWPAD